MYDSPYPRGRSSTTAETNKEQFFVNNEIRVDPASAKKGRSVMV